MKNLKICYRCRNKYYPVRSDQMYCSKYCRLKEYQDTAKAIRADNMRKHVIERHSMNYGIGGGLDKSYYNGIIYQYLGEDYGEFISWNMRKEAKIYSSQKRAENAMKKLQVKVANSEKLVVVPYEDLFNY